MPENHENAPTRELLLELLARMQRVEEKIHLLSRIVFESPWHFVETSGEPERAVYRALPQALSREEWARLVGAWPYRTGHVEWPVPPWQHLVWWGHPWRLQPYIRGRNTTVRQLVGTVKANNFTAEQAAEDLDLPVEAVREALLYAEKYKDMLESDAAYERHLLEQRGRGHGAPSVP